MNVIEMISSLNLIYLAIVEIQIFKFSYLIMDVLFHSVFETIKDGRANNFLCCTLLRRYIECCAGAAALPLFYIVLICSVPPLEAR